MLVAVSLCRRHKSTYSSFSIENIDFLENEILKINPKITIHLGKYTPTNLTEFKKEEKYLVFSGIGNHQTFVSMIKKNGLNILKDIEFPDHHTYTKSDLDNIINEASNLNCKIISTEKDYQRINNGYLSKIKIMKSELIIIDEEKLINSII